MAFRWAANGLVGICWFELVSLVTRIKAVASASIFIGHAPPAGKIFESLLVGVRDVWVGFGVGATKMSPSVGKRAERGFVAGLRGRARRDPALLAARLATGSTIRSMAASSLALRRQRPHVANMRVDAKRLLEDCTVAQTNRAASTCAHRNTGATAIIEPVLPLIRELREQKFSWAAIASALAKQGVVQGVDRRPITARRLTALISAIDKRERRRKTHMSGRAKRRDLAPLPASSQTVALSADLDRTIATAAAVTDSEAALRHQEFEDRVRSLLKDDPP
ncbi:hypothetical protein ABIA06_002080 [Bradyrhizobium yuanmingense]|uniref:hypothetical protein n=1 Tax=Bradyrhizobium yuanmingense TaxID=108015 RepID=UPI0035121265